MEMIEESFDDIIKTSIDKSAEVNQFFIPDELTPLEVIDLIFNNNYPKQIQSWITKTPSLITSPLVFERLCLNFIDSIKKKQNIELHYLFKETLLKTFKNEFHEITGTTFELLVIDFMSDAISHENKRMTELGFACFKGVVDYYNNVNEKIEISDKISSFINKLGSYDSCKDNRRFAVYFCVSMLEISKKQNEVLNARLFNFFNDHEVSIREEVIFHIRKLVNYLPEEAIRNKVYPKLSAAWTESSVVTNCESCTSFWIINKQYQDLDLFHKVLDTTWTIFTKFFDMVYYTNLLSLFKQIIRLDSRDNTLDKKIESIVLYFLDSFFSENENPNNVNNMDNCWFAYTSNYKLNDIFPWIEDFPLIHKITGQNDQGVDCNIRLIHKFLYLGNTDMIVNQDDIWLNNQLKIIQSSKTEIMKWLDLNILKGMSCETGVSIPTLLVENTYFSYEKYTNDRVRILADWLIVQETIRDWDFIISYQKSFPDWQAFLLSKQCNYQTLLYIVRAFTNVNFIYYINEESWHSWIDFSNEAIKKGSYIIQTHICDLLFAILTHTKGFFIRQIFMFFNETIFNSTFYTKRLYIYFISKLQTYFSSKFITDNGVVPSWWKVLNMKEIGYCYEINKVLTILDKIYFFMGNEKEKSNVKQRVISFYKKPNHVIEYYQIDFSRDYSNDQVIEEKRIQRETALFESETVFLVNIWTKKRKIQKVNAYKKSMHVRPYSNNNMRISTGKNNNSSSSVKFLYKSNPSLVKVTKVNALPPGKRKHSDAVLSTFKGSKIK